MQIRNVSRQIVNTLACTELLHTNECTVIYYISLKFTLKYLKISYMFRSLDHPQGAYIVTCYSYMLKDGNYFRYIHW